MYMYMERRASALNEVLDYYLIHVQLYIRLHVLDPLGVVPSPWD